MSALKKEQFMMVMVLGQLIKERKRQGLTISDIAKKMRTPRARISEIENGHIGLTLSRMYDYCEALGIVPFFSFKRTGIARLMDIAEEEGWRVSQDGSMFEMEKFSSAGQDFICCISGNTPSELVASLRSYANSFDPDEEATKWLGPDGHGRNGAPDKLRDIIADMDDCRDMMYGLLESWEEAIDD